MKYDGYLHLESANTNNYDNTDIWKDTFSLPASWRCGWNIARCYPVGNRAFELPGAAKIIVRIVIILLLITIIVKSLLQFHHLPTQRLYLKLCKCHRIIIIVSVYTKYWSSFWGDVVRSWLDQSCVCSVRRTTNICIIKLPFLVLRPYHLHLHTRQEDD